MTDFQYEINGKKYTQQELVLGQWQQLLKFLKGKEMPKMLSPRHVVEELGDDICEAIAIILREEGKHLKDKNIKELAKEIQFSIKPKLSLKIVKDFFVCNHLGSIMDEVAQEIMEILNQTTPILQKSSSSSAEETSPSEIKSSGDIP
jgi:hypothetical protein